jgi:hypothetical protein
VPSTSAARTLPVGGTGLSGAGIAAARREPGLAAHAHRCSVPSIFRTRFGLATGCAALRVRRTTPCSAASPYSEVGHSGPRAAEWATEYSAAASIFREVAHLLSCIRTPVQDSPSVPHFSRLDLHQLLDLELQTAHPWPRRRRAERPSVALRTMRRRHPEHGAGSSPRSRVDATGDPSGSVPPRRARSLRADTSADPCRGRGATAGDAVAVDHRCRRPRTERLRLLSTVGRGGSTNTRQNGCMVAAQTASRTLTMARALLFG